MAQSARSITMTIQPDQIEPLTRKRPIEGLAELIWNALDADATRIDVSCENDLLPDSIKSITVKDNGLGMPSDAAEEAFSNFGGSHKKESKKTPKGRPYHGQHGTGRYKSLSIGNHVEFLFHEKDKTTKLTLTEAFKSKPKIEVSEKVSQATGTLVTITQIKDSVKYENLFGTDSLNELKKRFCLYIEKFKDIKVFFNGTLIDFTDLKEEEYDLTKDLLDQITEDEFKDLSCQIVQWKEFDNGEVSRIYICNKNNQVIGDLPLHFKTRYPLSVFLSGAFAEDAGFEGRLHLSNIDENLQNLIRATKALVKKKDLELADNHAQEVVENLKKEELYPFSAEPKTEFEQQERRLFNVIASKVVVHSDVFNKKNAKKDDKKTVLHVLKTAVESGSKELLNVLKEISKLKQEEVEAFDLAIQESGGLLKIINTVNHIQERLKIISGIRTIHHHKLAKTVINERDHLHKIIENETWIFDEHFSMAVSERVLNTALNDYIKELGRESLIAECVTLGSDDAANETPDENDDENNRDRIDIGLFGKRISAGRFNQYINLVVELKRPSVTLGQKQLNQIKRYSRFVADDNRFPKNEHQWDFYLIGGYFNSDVEHELKGVKFSEPGLIHDSDNVKIYVKTWDSVLNEAEARMEYIKRTLQTNMPDDLYGYSHLANKYSHLDLPDLHGQVSEAKSN